MNSMTGFGRAEMSTRVGRLTVEMSSVNSRFLEFFLRLPKPFSSLEPSVREQITKGVERGKVSVFLSLEEPDDATGRYLINEGAAKAYTQQLRKLQKQLKLAGELRIGDLLALPDIAKPDKNGPGLVVIQEVVSAGVEAALKKMIAMRAREGRALATDMRKRLKAVAKFVARIEKRAGPAVKIYAERLTRRIEELAASVVKDKVRIEEEIALFAERTDVVEECVRLRSHLEQFAAALGNKGATGRKLNFLLQEMNREVNTIGSKSGDLDMSTTVIALKEEIEKLREQVQNVE